METHVLQNNWASRQVQNWREKQKSKPDKAAKHGKMGLLFFSCCFGVAVFVVVVLGGLFTYLFMFLTRVFSQQQQQQIPFTYVQTKKQNCVTQNHQPKSISLTQNYQHKSMNQPSQHAGSDPEEFWLWPVMASYGCFGQLAARISPDCIYQ